MSRLVLRAAVLFYVLALVLAPVTMVVVHALDQGVGALTEAITSPAAIHALELTLVATLVATVVNTIFGLGCAILLVRHRPRGSALVNAVIDLPFAISPIVVGLALLLTFGEQGWFGTALTGAGLQVVYAVPGIILATVFVTLPFVVREVMPVLEEVGIDQEQAAWMLGASGWATFMRITLPSIRWGVAYGVMLTVARALGEYGAVAVVSGKILGRTETMTVHIEDRFQSFDQVGVYGSALVLAAMAIVVFLGLMALAGVSGTQGRS